MRQLKSGRDCVFASLSLVAMLLDVKAQAVAPSPAGGQATDTVVISAPQPVISEGYQAVEARIKDILTHQPVSGSPFLNWCMENRFAQENASIQAARLPSEKSASLNNRIHCARAHIESSDITLRQGFEAFDKQDYTTAFQFFQQAYSKKRGADAALMRAKMHFDGLGTPRDPARGMKFKMAADAGYSPAAYRLGTGAAVSTHTTAVVVAQSVDKTFKSGASIRSEGDQGVVNAGHTPDKLPAGSVSDQPTADLKRSGSQNQADTAAVPVVRVTGLRAIPWKSYRAMRAAIAAYEKYKYLAPDAVFSFAIVPTVGKTLPPNFELRVRTKDGEEFPIRLEGGELFQLPVLPDPDADANLVSNLKEGQLRIGLLLHTRNIPPEVERLGDVRLRNEISQAIRDVEHPDYDPMCWRKRGARQCRPQHVAVWYKPRAPASGAWLVEGNRREALETNGDPKYPSYKIPVNAGHLGNDVTIEFDYKNPLGSIKQTVVMIYDEGDR